MNSPLLHLLHPLSPTDLYCSNLFASTATLQLCYYSVQNNDIFWLYVFSSLSFQLGVERLMSCVVG